MHMLYGYLLKEEKPSAQANHMDQTASALLDLRRMAGER